MKRESKAASFLQRLAFFSMVLLLAACADARGPQWLTGEPGEDVLNAPRVVAAPAGATQDGWPNLADVPETKPKFTALEERSQKTATLTSDSLQAGAALERIRNIDLYGEQARMQRTSQD